MNAYRVISLVRLMQPLSAMCGSFLPVLNPVVKPGLRAGTCAVLCGSLLTVCKQVHLSINQSINLYRAIVHLCNKELLYFTFISPTGNTSASTEYTTDVTIIESEIEIEFFLENRIESKSIFLAGNCNRF